MQQTTAQSIKTHNKNKNITLRAKADKITWPKLRKGRLSSREKTEETNKKEQTQRENQIKEFSGTTPLREIGLVTHRSQIKARIDEAVSTTVNSVMPDLPKIHSSKVLMPLGAI